MTPEEIVDHVEIDMKEGGDAYQPAYWKTKLLLRIQALQNLAKEEGRKHCVHNSAKEFVDGATKEKAH